ncbi:RNA polymerase sigma factor [Pseudolysinimonas yzui]|uniref:RNA polymerase sigma factor n=1 Tax=Pseudolysinimonas yzui TaxID=2708254 RepID=UPI0017495C04|nr:sigma-70 family RNA polymerase sigma factor [Pseudolysinimonas yzui]
MRDVTDAEREKLFRTLAVLVVEPVRRYLARRTDPATAEDVLNETLLVCWRRLDEVPRSPEGAVSHDAVPWAIVVARNLLSNAQRADRRRTRLVGKIIALDPPASVIEESPHDDTAEAELVRDALTRLRSADAELLRLWAWDGLESPQLATVLGISANAAAIRLHRAKTRLRAELLNSRPLVKSASPAGHVEAEKGGENARR